MGLSLNFDGDALAARVPLLGRFRDDLHDTIAFLSDIAACLWAEGVPADDAQSLQARDNIKQMFDQYIMPAYRELADALGFQGEKLGLVKQIGDHTEHANGEVATSWSSGHKA
jgi:hypothetical protein